MKRNNLNIKNAACLHVVHILQHPTCRPSTKATQNTIVNAPEKNLSPLSPGKYGKSTNHCTPRCHHVNEGKSDFEADRVWAPGALPSLRSKKKLVVGKRRQIDFLPNKEMEKWIEDYVERETAAALKRVEDTETAIKHEEEDMWNAEKAVLTTTTPGTMYEEMSNTIRESLSDQVSSNHGEDGENEDDAEEDPELGKLSEDDEPGWVIGTISEIEQHRMECFRQEEMKLDQSVQPCRGDAAEYICERDMTYWMTKLKVPPVVQPQMDDDETFAVPMTVGERMEILHCVAWKSQMPQVTSPPGSCDMKLELWTRQTHERILSVPPAAAPDSTMIPISKHVETVSFNPCIWHPMRITIRKSDSDEDMVTAPASIEESMGKMTFLTIYRFQKQYVYLFCHLSSFTWIQ